MWKLFGVRSKPCSLFAGNLQDAAEQLPAAGATREQLRAGLSPEMREHAERCANCALALDDLLAVRESFQSLRSSETPADSWFPQRVMARIAAAQLEMESGNATWKAVPRLASRLAGVAALVLLLAVTWVAGIPATVATGSTTTVAAAEGLFESPQPAPTPDDPLASVLERDR